MTPAVQYKYRKKEEFLGAEGLNTTMLGAKARVMDHMIEGANRIELYLDHRGWHLCAHYKERITGA